jgi:hypothetical protein
VNDFRYMTDENWDYLLEHVNEIRGRRTKEALKEGSSIAYRWQIDDQLCRYGSATRRRSKLATPGPRRRKLERLRQDLAEVLQDPVALADLNEAAFLLSVWEGHPPPRGPVSPTMRCMVCRSDDATVSPQLWIDQSNPLGADQRPVAWGHAMARCLQDALEWLVAKEVPRNPEPDAAIAHLLTWMAVIYKTMSMRDAAATSDGPFSEFLSRIARACPDLNLLGHLTPYRLKKTVAEWKKSTARSKRKPRPAARQP